MTDNRGYREDLRGHWVGNGSSNFFFDEYKEWYDKTIRELESESKDDRDER